MKYVITEQTKSGAMTRNISSIANYNSEQNDESLVHDERSQQ